ncbi:MAG: hypothetical protein H6713_32975 [Myxococcales bacterium]|nr:hypothetical protein [Myxococcales bacterium]
MPRVCVPSPRPWSLAQLVALSLLCGCLADVGGGGNPWTTTDTSATNDSVDNDDDDDDDDTGESTTGAPGDVPEPDWPLLECDPIVPAKCAFPFPSNVYTVPSDSPTGRRVLLSEAMMPVTKEGTPSLPDIFSESDGFSPGSALLAYFPGVTTTGLADAKHVERSLEDDSPTVLLNAETGERVLHWAELDETTKFNATRTFIIRPAVRLDDSARYVVAIRGLVDDQGAALPASPVFAALRDRGPHDDPSVEPRRDLYENIFARLEEAGVARDDLQLAWDFTTASEENNTRWLLHMRDEALALVGQDGPGYTITKITEDWSPNIALRVEGKIEVPRYLDDPGPGGELLLGEDGLPEPDGVAEYPFLLLVPNSALEEPAGIMQFGHGLFGKYTDVENSAVQALANEHNFVAFGMDWIGLSEQDIGTLGGVFGGDDISAFKTVPDRLHQAVLNAHLGMRLLQTGLYEDPALRPGGAPLIDPNNRAFFGASLGGIMGSVYMATTVDVTRGGLGVPGQPFNLLLTRSELFDPFLATIQARWPDPLDVMLMYTLIQLLWDRAEPTGYTHRIRDPLPNTPAHEVLMQVALGDHLVTNYGSWVMARTLGVVNVGDDAPEIFGVPRGEQGHEGTGMIVYDFGLPPIPVGNVPMTEGSDPHGKSWDYAPARDALVHFINTGEVKTFCDGRCDPD